MSNKLSLIAYEDNSYEGEGTGTCTVLINPSSYSHEHSVQYNNATAQGAPGTTLKFKAVPPEKVSFEVNFDGTGTIDNNKVDVESQIKEFKNICFDYNGEIHEPNFLIISWGSLVFKCKLTSLSLKYTLFKKDGTPLRAKATVKFEEAISANNIAKEANEQSPDLTHMILIKAGDTLPLICNNIYGDPSYYLEVASYNNLVNFRNLKPGTKIYLPPIK